MATERVVLTSAAAVRHGLAVGQTSHIVPGWSFDGQLARLARTLVTHRVGLTQNNGNNMTGAAGVLSTAPSISILRSMETDTPKLRLSGEADP